MGVSVAGAPTTTPRVRRSARHRRRRVPSWLRSGHRPHARVGASATAGTAVAGASTRTRRSDRHRRRQQRSVLAQVGAAVGVLLVLVAYGTIDNRWYRVLPVHGNSMSPTLAQGDAIVITPPPSTVDEIEPGTIVTMEVGGQLVTHRWLGVSSAGVPMTEGDANRFADDWTDVEVRVVGVQRLRLPLVGHLMTWVRGLRA